ncbi:MAG TPA: metal-dependent transcriptional regulator [Spirochaetia bacterium]|nr:metal-dependent transcriptional regulator [Spirochaetia bacterium]
MEIDAAEVHERFPAAAEYLSGIYILQRDYGRVSNSRLAAWTGVSGSAVTQALGRLKKLGLARQVRYENIELTPRGRALAVTVLRRHFLLEHLLVRILEFPWEKADDEAKRLQSQISADLTEHLYKRLGSPQACPHGNPMPGSKMERKLLTAPKLIDAPAGLRIRILRITEEGEQIPRMLDFCHSRGIRPGASFRVESNRAGIVRLSGDARAVSVPSEKAAHIRYETAPRSPGPV